MTDVHSVDNPDSVYPDLSERAIKVSKNLPTRPTFARITAKELTNAFTCGLTVRNGIIANALLSCENVSAEARAAPSGRRARRRKRKTGSDECIAT